MFKNIKEIVETFLAISFFLLTIQILLPFHKSKISPTLEMASSLSIIVKENDIGAGIYIM